MKKRNRILTLEDLKKKIRLIPNYPKKGITFKDLGPLYEDSSCFYSVVEHIAMRIKQPVDIVASTEAQGFILGGALAQRLNSGFVQIRKKGELPGKTRRVDFDMQYASTTLEIQEGIFPKNKKILIFDDAIATGYTARASKSLVESEGGVVVGFAFVMELDGLGGREVLGYSNIISLIHFFPEE
jgi:adenine phosphoribosyltransferase